MRVIRPVQVTPGALVSSVPENDAPEWSAGTYELDVRVVKDHHVYRSLVSGNTSVPGEDATKWLDTGATNRWRMFDKRAAPGRWLIGRETRHAGEIDVTITPGRVVNALGLVGLRGTSVRVVMEDPLEGVVFDRSYGLVDHAVSNWYDYWFAPFERRMALVIMNLPPYGSATVRVIVSATEGDATVGMLVLGSRYDIGVTEWGVEIDSVGFSVLKEDPWGDVDLTSRGHKRVVGFPIRIATPRIGGVMRVLEELRDTPSLFIGSQDMEVSMLFGRYDRLATVITDPALCDMRLDVRSFQ